MAVDDKEQIMEWLKRGNEIDAQRARRATDEWLQDEPLNPRALFLRAMSLAIQHKIEEALPLLGAALLILPDHQGLRYHRSSLLLSLQRYDEALDEARAAQALGSGDIDDARLYRVIAEALLELRRFDEAWATIQELEQTGLVEVSLCLVLQTIQGDFAGLRETLSLMATYELTKPHTTISLPPRPDSLATTFAPWVEFLHDAVEEGLHPSLILQCVDLPPGDLTPATPEYIDWWRSELADPGWEDEAWDAVALLRMPGMEELFVDGQVG